MWCGRWRSANTCGRRRASKTCTGPIGSAAAPAAASRWSRGSKPVTSAAGPANKRLCGRCMALTALLFAGIATLFGAAWWVASLGPPPLGKDLRFSASVLDRNGRLLRAYATDDGRWRLQARIGDVDPRFFDVLFAY